MERSRWREDELFLTSMLLGVDTHIMYLLSTGRNAWHETWSARYEGPTSLHFTLNDAKKTAERDRVQGTVFNIEQVPVLAFRCRTGVAYCAEFHSQESFKMLDWDGEMEFLKIGAALPDVMNAFSKPDPSSWNFPWPVQDSFVTRVFDLVGNVDPSNGKTSPIEAEPLVANSKLNRWKSFPKGTGYRMGWDISDSDRNITSTEKVVERFNALNSPQLKLDANGLYVAAEKFVRSHYEENWILRDYAAELELAVQETMLEFPDLFPPVDE